MSKASLAGLIIFCLSSLVVAKDVAPKSNPLALMRADHIMISTDDYRATVDWYNSVLGFELLHDWRR